MRFFFVRPSEKNEHGALVRGERNNISMGQRHYRLRKITF